MLVRWFPFLVVLLLGVAPAPASGSAGPVVAVLDSGIDASHPDLARRLWRNPGEVAGNGRDDDGNGFVDDVHGADMIDRDGSPGDSRGHGTHVAAIVAGGGSRARIMAVRIIGDDGLGWNAQLAAGIDYAQVHGARVINLSVSGYSHDPAVAAALARAAAAGIVVVTAAGNRRLDLDRTPLYPASYRTPGMLVVAAAGANGRLASWSGRGSRSVDLVAPGVAIRSALPGRRHGRKSGTSQSAARVSRAVARVLSLSPALTASGVCAALLGTVDSAPALSKSVASGGTLDLRAAVALLRP